MRRPTVLRHAMVASSHPLVTQAGLRALDQGGNAVDAALAMAAIATVAEPNTNGLGGDMFAIVWNDGTLAGLNASGRSAAHLRSSEVAARDRVGHGAGRTPRLGDLAGRYGRFGLDRALRARGRARGSRRPLYEPDRGLSGRSRTTRRGLLLRRRSIALPELATTLREVAEDGPDAFYAGEVARAIASRLLARRGRPRGARVRVGRANAASYHGVDVCELPPNSQGVTALLALGSSTVSSRPCTTRSSR